MQTSTKAKAALKREEGAPLRAYLCPAGKWTIYVGITSSAGVGPVTKGMVITEEQGEAMLSAALKKTFEPRVAKHMPGAAQNEYDAGVLFDWNTGAIDRASWVTLWVKKAARDLIAAKFKLWNKGGGKVLPGLVARRERELKILLDNEYPADARQPAPVPVSPHAAVWALPMTATEKAAAIAGFRALGYPLAPETGMPDVANAVGVRAFQRDHGLTVDGIVGRATLSTLQRRLDASKKAGLTSATAAASMPVALTDYADQLVGLPHAGGLMLAGTAIYASVQLWRYRDAVAAEVQGSLPRVAAFLRSI